MNSKILTIVLSLAALAAGALPAQAQQPEQSLQPALFQLIDDFSQGPYDVALRNGSVTAQQSDPTGAHIYHGVRQTVFTVGADNSFNQPTVLHIRRHPPRITFPMIIDAGLKSPWSLYLVYGVDIDGQYSPLNLSVVGSNKFRVYFDSADLTISMGMTIYSRDNDGASMSKAVVPVPDGSHFYADFPFSDFEATGPNPIDWRDIDTIVVLFQAGTSTQANDFGVTKIVAIKAN